MCKKWSTCFKITAFFSYSQFYGNILHELLRAIYRLSLRLLALSVEWSLKVTQYWMFFGKVILLFYLFLNKCHFFLTNLISSHHLFHISFHKQLYCVSPLLSSCFNLSGTYRGIKLCQSSSVVLYHRDEYMELLNNYSYSSASSVYEQTSARDMQFQGN